MCELAVFLCEKHHIYITKIVIKPSYQNNPQLSKLHHCCHQHQSNISKNGDTIDYFPFNSEKEQMEMRKICLYQLWPMGSNKKDIEFRSEND